MHIIVLYRTYGVRWAGDEQWCPQQEPQHRRGAGVGSHDRSQMAENDTGYSVYYCHVIVSKSYKN